MNRFFVEQSNIIDGEILITDREDIHHIVKVLRLKAGDICDISDSAEWEYNVEITSISKDEVRTKILDKQKFAKEPKLKVTLFQGVPKQGKMETIIQKSVELGVHNIVPVFTARTVVLPNDNFGKKIERWQKVSAEAVKQCKRGIIPHIESAVSFVEMLELIKPEKDGAEKFDAVLFPYENEENYSIKSALRELQESFKRSTSEEMTFEKASKNAVEGKESTEEAWLKNIAIIIGPEGGFSDDEASKLKEAGAYCVTLGKTILRTETAGPTAIAMVMYELEL